MGFHWFKPILFVVFGVGFCWSQAAPAASSGSGESLLAANTAIPAELSKSIDAKKAKVGDPIEARSTMDVLAHGQIVLPRNSRILGHVTAAKAHSKDSPDSSIGFAFDRVKTKDGSEVALKTSVRAIGEPMRMAEAETSPYNSGGGIPQASSGIGGGSTGAGSIGGGSVGGAQASNGRPGYPSGGASDVPPDNGPQRHSVSPLGPGSHGVIGLKNLSLESEGDAAVVKSSNNNVHLDSGTQLVLETK